MPRVAITPDGRFVVAWHGRDVFAQRYDASGTPLGAEFRVNTYTTNYQGSPSIATDAAGNFVVVWNSEYQDDSAWDVFGQRFDASGASRGGEFRVNSHTTGFQGGASVAMDPAGNFVVAWTGYEPENVSNDIFAQRYDATGTPRGAQFRVNTSTLTSETAPSVDADAAGNFVVAWQAGSRDGWNYGNVFAQRYDASGAPRGGEFRVNPDTSWQVLPRLPSVAMNASGDFVVTWLSASTGIRGQLFDASGTARGGEFGVNTSPWGWIPSVSMEAAGNFVVCWEGQDGHIAGILARRFDASGTPRGPEFQVNTFTTGDQRFPAVATDAIGNFVVAWLSVSQSWGVFGQRFGGLHPRALGIDTAGNRVLDPGEAASVAPSWQNLTGAPQAFAGTLANISGPAGCAQVVVDGVADYGTAGDGVTASCTTDCYAVSATASTPRCIQHWDIRTIETLTPAAQGQAKEWILHVGDSFTDVPTTGPFYRFIETLLHHGVTAGCTTTEYCPANVTRREQMAAFVMVAKEGGGYRPPACTTPIFNDVPAASPFCPFIEELFRRGAVHGCGGGSYCPLEPVTRGQMSVFGLRALDNTFVPPPCVPPNMFDDVPESHVFCPWIEELARRGVVTGCGGGNYCPADPVTREQMAVFISVTFGLRLYGP